MPVPVLTGTVGSPGTRGGQNGPTIVAQEVPRGLLPGIAFREGETAQSEHSIQATAPGDAEALVHVRREGPTLHAGDTTAPGGRVGPGELYPTGKGHRGG